MPEKARAVIQAAQMMSDSPQTIADVYYNFDIADRALEVFEGMVLAVSRLSKTTEPYAADAMIRMHQIVHVIASACLDNRKVRYTPLLNHSLLRLGSNAYQWKLLVRKATARKSCN